jgi:hypothetical protein
MAAGLFTNAQTQSDLRGGVAGGCDETCEPLVIRFLNSLRISRPITDLRKRVGDRGAIPSPRAQAGGTCAEPARRNRSNVGQRFLAEMLSRDCYVIAAVSALAATET